MIEAFNPVDRLEKDYKNLFQKRKDYQSRIKRYKKKIESYERRKKKTAKKSRKKLKKVLSKAKKTDDQLNLLKRKINDSFKKALSFEKSCWSWEAYSNASKVDHRLFKYVNFSKT